MDKYDYVIVGAGLAGGVLARKLAEKQNKKILMIERRNHLAGNMYDFTDEHGIRVQMYGPHIIHTNIDEVYELIARFCEVVPYRTYCEVVIDEVSTPSPFNFKTIDQFYDAESATKLKQLLLEYYKGRKEVSVVDMLAADEPTIKEFAQFLFEKDYKLYTAKQWNLRPDEISPSVLKRVPIVLSYKDTCFADKYELLPKDGFEVFYKNLIDHPNITVHMGVDALQYLEIDVMNKVILFKGEKTNLIYTGAIDELFNYKFGALPYRSLNFIFKSYHINSFQNVAIVAYPQAEGYTRITEYTKMPEQKGLEWTSIAYEFPVEYNKYAAVGNEPYYPVLTEQSQSLYRKYRDYADQFNNLILCGRLADFKYYNMDQVISRALDIFNTLEGE